MTGGFVLPTMRAMSSIGTANRTILDDWASAWSAHDLQKVLSLFIDDCIYEDVALGVVNRGKDQLRAFGAAFLAGVPDLRVELTESCATENRAAVEWVMSGTHTGDLPGMPASGKPFSIRGCTVCELENGKTRRNSDY
jgi:steroid delta-isomerase-like uncharacterized protein